MMLNEQLDSTPRELDLAREVVPERVSRGIVENGGEQYRKMWSDESISTYTLEDYVNKMRQSSGHFAVHAIPRSDLALQCIDRGYIKATGLEGEKPQGDMAAESQAVHFSVDQVYWTNISKVGLLVSGEALLENKSFMDSPFREDNQPNQDWPVRGLSDHPNDESNKFYFDGLGIVLLPKTINESFAQQHEGSWVNQLRNICKTVGIEKEFFQTEGIILPTTTLPAEQIFKRIFEKTGKAPKRVYFYNGNNLEDGVREFIQNHGIEPKAQVTVSGRLDLATKSMGETHGGAGKGDFYAVKSEP